MRATHWIGIVTAVALPASVIVGQLSPWSATHAGVSAISASNRTSSETPPERVVRHLPAGVPSTFIGGRVGNIGVGLYSTATGRLIRMLSRSQNDIALALSSDGRAVYVSNSRRVTGRCTRKVPVTSGPARAAGFCAANLAVSRDGQMLAYTTVDGLTVSLVVRNRATGWHRRLLIYRNCRGCNNGVGGAELAWSPDDRHLVISIAATAAIQSLQRLNVYTGRVWAAPVVAQCNGNTTTCDTPAYDSRGRLLFTRVDRHGQLLEVRWARQHLTVLHRFSTHRYGFEPIVVDSAGNAFMWQSTNAHNRGRRTDVWVDGQVHELYASKLSASLIPDLWH
jgi:hypothetical protein